MIKNRNPQINWIKERSLWWRCFGPIVFAHKPLCSKFHSHTLQLGSFRICRSCLLLWSGIVTTALIAAMDLMMFSQYQMIIPFILGVVMLGSHPQLYKRIHRFGKDGLRFLLGLLISYTLLQFLVGEYVIGIVFAGLLWSSKFIYSRIRMAERDGVCETCPEYQSTKICSGYKYKSQRMRLYERGLSKTIIQK